MAMQDVGSAPRPSGTVTLLFTDIEGSTRHWEEQRAAMADALQRHDRLLRSAIETHGGYVFKTVGDEFCAVFSRASDAVAAAAYAQRALAAEDWTSVGEMSVRMALHSGAADEREGDYFGPAVNRVARLMAVVHGGQVVTSQATAQLLRGLMPEQAELRDLGEHRLRDLVEPERVWQLVAPGLREAFPPLASLGSLPNNLPRQVTPLIGRDDVLSEIEPLVLEHPLVTLVGTGGVGKTRLALQAGADLLDGSADGVWLVELAPLSDKSLLVNTIASTFALREQASRPMLDVLLNYLRSRRLLLILDNCEHLIEEVAKIADTILLAASQVRVLATSREPLRINAEHVYRVPSLAFPSNGSLTSAEALRFGAVALFAERARAADAKFALTDESAAIVAEICRRLDGIALAIELAAVRVKVMAPRQLAQKLDERFRVLTGGSRTALPRQQTMRALIDWSYDLLSAAEQQLFRRVSIFVGGWTLDAAETVCSDETLDALDVTDLIASLVEKSLVVADVGRDSTRYRLLESTRAFGLEKLEQSGERETLAHRHARWVADLGDRAYAARCYEPTSEWRIEFARDLDNARAAIDWTLSHHEIVLAARILGGFWALYRTLVGQAQVRSRLERVLERLNADAEPAIAAHIWWAVSDLAVGSYTIEAAERAVELGLRGNDPAITALSLDQLALGFVQAGRAQEARAVIDRGLQFAREHGLTRILATILTTAAGVAGDCGQADEARQFYAEGLALATTLGNKSAATMMRLGMAELEFSLGNPARALELATETEIEEHAAVASVLRLGNGAAYRIALGDIAGARSDAREELRLARGVFPLETTIAIQHLATVAALSGDPRRGARLRGYVDARYRDMGYAREPTEQRTYEILTAALGETLSGSEIEALGAEGAQLSEDAAISEALSMSP